MTGEEAQIKFDQQVELKERLEHRDATLAIASIIKTPEGKALFKYLFTTLEITKLPDENLEGNMLYENLGFLRAGNSIYKLACQADFESAASILSKLERERYEHTCKQYNLDNNIDDTDTRE